MAMGLPQRAPKGGDLAIKLFDPATDPRRITRLLQLMLGVGYPTQDGEYLHWDSIRHRTPPRDFSHEEWWFAILAARRPFKHAMPLIGTNGEPFTYALVDLLQRLLHQIDVKGA